MKEGFVDEEVYTPEMSAGGVNAYYMDGCDAVGHRPAYGVCLHKIACYEREKKLPPGMLCETEIRNRKCPALKMRQEERDAGVALYFVNRVKMREFVEKREEEEREALKAKRKMDITAGKSKYKLIELPSDSKANKPAPKPGVKKIEESPQNGYAEAINRAVSKLDEEKSETPPAQQEAQVEMPAQPAKAGMSLLELARMRLNKK